MVSFEQDIAQCLDVLKKGGLIVYPTDTIWGIGCDATNEEAVAKIYALKQRADSKSMIVLVGDERSVLQYTAAPDLGVFDFIAQYEKPTTVIYEGAIGLAANLLAPDGSIGIRICKELFCKHLIRRFQKPLVSTSANLSGQPSPANFAAIDPVILEGVDYTVHFRRDDTRTSTPSTIIRWKQNGPPEIIRP